MTTPKPAPRAFQDQPSDFDLPPDPLHGFGPIVVYGCAAVLALAVIWTGWTLVSHLTHEWGGVRIYLTGPGVSELHERAAVAVGSKQVGKVEAFEVKNGVQVAVLRIERKYADDIPRSASFTVRSLNHWLPGNIGVSIAPTRSDDPLRLIDGMGVTADGALLPAAVPPRFLMLVGAGVFVLAAVGVVARMMKSLIVFLAAAAIVVGVFVQLGVRVW